MSTIPLTQLDIAGSQGDPTVSGLFRTNAQGQITSGGAYNTGSNPYWQGMGGTLAEQQMATTPVTAGQVLSSQAPAPSQQQQQQPSSGSINQGNLTQYFPGYSGWDSNSAWQDYLATGGAGKGGSTGGGGVDQSALLNQIFDPIMGGISDAENLLGQTKQTSLAGVQLQSDQSQRALQSAYQQALAQSKTQTNDTELARRTALAQNAKNLRDISQQILSRYGLGASTGGNLVSIATDEFFRTQGSIFDKSQSALNKIYDFQNQSVATYNMGVQKLNEDILQQQKVIEDDYSAKLLALENQKLQTQSAKAQAQFNLADQFKTRIQTLADQAKQEAVQLQAYMAQSEAAVNGSTSAIGNLVNNLVAQSNQYLAQIGELPNNNIISPNTQQTNATSYSYWNPAWFNSTDNSKDTLNPFQ